MMRPEHRQRFEKALQAGAAAGDLWNLAHTLRDEGATQVDLYLLYEHYQQLQSDDDPKYDAITDVMDIIWGGGWAKGFDLFPHELTSDEIEKHRTLA